MSWSAKVAMCRVTSRRGGDRGWVRRASHRCESTGRETHPQLPCPFRLQLPPHACMAAEPPRTTAYIYTRRLLRRADERQRPSPKTEFCHSSVWPKSFCRARLPQPDKSVSAPRCTRSARGAAEGSFLGAGLLPPTRSSFQSALYFANESKEKPGKDLLRVVTRPKHRHAPPRGAVGALRVASEQNVCSTPLAGRRQEPPAGGVELRPLAGARRAGGRRRGTPCASAAREAGWRVPRR